MQILVVEDDDHVAAALCDVLAARGHECTRVATAAAVWRQLDDADLVVLDLDLPDGDGLDVLADLRRVSEVTVLVFTGRDDGAQVDLGLTLGADDYLVKPVRLAELVARVDAAHRRITVASHARSVMRIEDLQVDLATTRAIRNGRELRLDAAEFALLAVLVRRQGLVVSRTELCAALPADDQNEEPMRMALRHLNRLRVALGRPTLLRAVRGIGYRLER